MIKARPTYHYRVPDCRIDDPDWSVVLDTSECRVNSLHHQSIDRLGNGLAVVSRDAYNIVQAIEQPSALFLIGVQWHPEFLVFDTGQVRLFRRLVVAARDHRDRS